VPAAATALPTKLTLEPNEQSDVAEFVRQAYAGETPLYVVGGGTSLDYGLPARDAGNVLSTTKLNRVVDYPARDLTVTVEAGMTMRALSDLLAKEKQRLPIDVPQADRATIGGVIATNFNGPRRYGQGTVRDYVIGISAVDGRGECFKGGGRVVKNVAGYDFCKLLTGSLGTLGVITQVTLKLKPMVEQSRLMACAVKNAAEAERMLAALSASQTTPVAVELLAGPAWTASPSLATLGSLPAEGMYIVVGLEGTASEVEWSCSRLSDEWNELGVEMPFVLGSSAALWRELIEFPAVGESPLVLKASVKPSGTTSIVEAARKVDPNCSVQAHAGNGVAIIKFDTFPASGLSRALVGDLQPAAAKHLGNICVLSNPSASEMTHQSAWGGIDAPFGIMSEVKRRFDPKDLLNRGRFVYI
jgi:glycolate oxidase FAD binding subunit